MPRVDWLAAGAACFDKYEERTATHSCMNIALYACSRHAADGRVHLCITHTNDPYPEAVPSGLCTRGSLGPYLGLTFVWRVMYLPSLPCQC